jgi:hypothetical protein
MRRRNRYLSPAKLRHSDKPRARYQAASTGDIGRFAILRPVRRAVVVAALLALVPSTGGANDTRAAVVRVIDRSPVVVRGLRFLPAERVTVRVSVRGGPRVSKTIRAGAAGSFTARFLSLRLGQCAAFTVNATGARGSRGVHTELFPPCGPAP